MQWVRRKKGIFSLSAREIIAFCRWVRHHDQWGIVSVGMGAVAVRLGKEGWCDWKKNKIYAPCL